MSVILSQIEERRAKLYSVAEKLKEKFVGIDEPIDKLVMNIEAWWCMPDMMTRPTIVCLWGLTGVGKTDLIRTMVQELGMVDSFVELQMTNKGSANHYDNTLRGVLADSNLSEKESGILLLDEMQRFRSKDAHGDDIDDYSFQDLWMLLSDGSFGSASDNKDALFQMLFENAYWTDYNNARKASKKNDEDSDEDDDEKDEKEFAKRRKFKRNYWSAMQIKKELRLDDDVQDIMQWDSSKKIEILTQKLDDKSIYEPVKYPKLLILIAGNLDEAYQMSQQAEETDIEADIFHKFSQKINVVTIKQALGRRFKPEQIARFGNSHIIYPALNKASYSEIIRRRVKSIVEKCHNHTGVEFEVDQSVLDAIYRNGVFPAQGTRPVFSTISCFFECMLPQFVYRCIQNEITKARLYYRKRKMCCDLPDGTFSIENEGDIDKIKTDAKSEDKVRKVAIHEAGHAIVYAALFGVNPTQIAVNLASNDKNGFIGIHDVDATKQGSLDKVCCLLAGRVAEEMVFGPENRNAGAYGDLLTATNTVASVLRQWGMGDNISCQQVLASDDAIAFNNDTDASNDLMEKMLQEQKERAHHLLTQHKDLLIEMSDFLVTNSKIESKEFTEMCGKHGIESKYLDAKKMVRPRYEEMYQKYLDGSHLSHE